MHVGPLSRNKFGLQRTLDGFFAILILIRAGLVVIRNLPVVANEKIALSVQSQKLDKLAYE